MRKIVYVSLIGLLGIIYASGASAQEVRHALVGTVKTIDHAAKTVAIKTADGTVETVKWTDKTMVLGVKKTTKAIDFAGRKGTHVIVHYSVEGSKKTAKAMEFLGKETPKAVEGTIKTVSKGSRTVIVKTADGTEKTFDISEHAVVESGEGIVDAGKFVGEETAKGAKISVHYTEKGGRLVARFFKRL